MSVNRFWLRMYYDADPTSGPDLSALFFPYVLDTDFSLVASSGHIFNLGAELLAGTKVDFDYEYTTTTAKRFNVLEATNIEGSARLTFLPDTGVGFNYFMHKVSLKTNGAFEFADADWIAPPSLLEVLDGTSDGFSSSPFGFIDVFDV